MSLLRMNVIGAESINRYSFIWLPAVPRIGDTLTLPDAHYIVDIVDWQPHEKVLHDWAECFNYTVRLWVSKKFKDEDEQTESP